MDEDRRIRFLIAPMLFFASVAWAVVSDPNSKLSTLLPGVSISIDSWWQGLAALAAGGILTVAIGVVIGTISHVLLRMGFWLKAKLFGGSTTHEISVDPATLKLMWHKLKESGAPKVRDQLFIGVTFDHDVLLKDHEGVHRWLVRRWNAFSVAVTSMTGLALSFLVLACLLNVSLAGKWWAVVSIAFLSFSAVAVLAWRDMMGMLSFQARRVSGSANEG